MNKDKWLDLVDMLEEKFGLDKDQRAELDSGAPGYKHTVEFKSPAGKIRLEWTEKARLVDVKTNYSNRVGSFTKVDKIYAPEDKVNFLEAFAYDEPNAAWEKIDLNSFMNF